MAACIRRISGFRKCVSVVREGFLMHTRPTIVTSHRLAHGPRLIRPVVKGETEKEFDDRFENWFNSEEIDDWELRQGLNVLYGHDLVPEPRIVDAMLRAARRLNDVAMSIRILEAVNEKGANNKEICDYIIQSVRPTLDELGISTPEELGLDKVQELSAYTTNVLGLNTTSPAAAVH